MAHHKLLLDDEFEELYSLIAIHCSEEAYKMAFLLNKFGQLLLKRRATDLEFQDNGLEVTFPLFEFENEFAYTNYFMVANKCKSVVAQQMSTGGLFEKEVAEKVMTTYLIPELKNVDFFLKIESDSEKVPTRKMIASINEIKEVISAYEVDLDTIKTKNNLIFY